MDLPLQRIEGAGTLRTYKMPQNCERVEMLFETNGRPMHALVELWLGPIRRTHCLEIYNEDGSLTPVRACLKFKKGPQVLKVSNTGGLEFPMLAGVRAVPEDRNNQLASITESVWNSNEKHLFQGGATGTSMKGPGAVRTFPIEDKVESVQILFWSAAVGRKSTKAKIEILQGPNFIKQSYDLQLSGGSQPYHAVFMTPGDGVSVRIRSNHFLEFPFECMVIPFETGEAKPALQGKEWWDSK